MIELSPEIRDYFAGEDPFDEVMGLEGKLYRAKEGRQTMRFEHSGEYYFAKVHRGIGWLEIWKNLLCFHKPVTNASTEWLAVEVLERESVETVEVVGKGFRGWNPAYKDSFVITKSLDELVEVEDFLKDLGGLQGRRRLLLKRTIIRKVAGSARKMHGAGMNHRDYYLSHFHIIERDWSDWTPDEDFRVPVIDLHRAQIRSEVPFRWLAKDLGALLFSAIDCGVTDRDVVAFLKEYLGKDWKDRLRKESKLWRAVLSRARGFYKRHRGKEVKFPGVFQFAVKNGEN